MFRRKTHGVEIYAEPPSVAPAGTHLTIPDFFLSDPTATICETLSKADGLLSLILYRHSGDLDEDLKRDLFESSQECRHLARELTNPNPQR